MITQRSASLSKHDPYWLVRAVTAGFVATVLVTATLALAYGMAVMLGSNHPDAPILVRWLWGLAHNTVTARFQTAVPVVVLLHFIFGINWAIIYAAVVEPRLSGPGWRRGLLFAPIPWLLSLLVFLPAVGGGFLGLSLGAGPLPILGNLILHLVYGATLGALYPEESNRLLVEAGTVATSGEIALLTRSEYGTAAGIIIGMVLGALIAWVGQVILAPNQSGLVALMLGALMGSATGALIGSFLGLSPERS